MKHQRPERIRRLHSGHFAFMRSIVQGVDQRTAWDRYIRLEGEHSDARKVKSTIGWIRAEFAAAARRESKPGTARLVLIDTALLKDSAAKPSLEEFAKSRGMEDFSEAEQAEAYREEFGGPTRRTSRRAQLVNRQLAALRWLEDLVAQSPRPSDPVGVWLAPALADRIERAGMPTIFALMERINGIGSRWWTKIPGIGSLKAARIVEWLQIHQSEIGMPIGAHVVKPRMQLDLKELAAVVPPSTSLVPLEKFLVPGELDGSQGRYRADPAKCMLRARNDYEAILEWLASKQSGKDGAESPTQRAYRKEAERLLLWAVLERGVAISSLQVADVNDYVRFLEEPPASWTGVRYQQRWSPNWRPLEGPLKPSAIRYTLIVLRGLFSFLKEQNYVVGNPFKGVQLPKEASRTLGSRRALTFEQWDIVRAQLGLEPNNEVARRRDRAIRWLYLTGLRLAELTDARCSHLRRHAYSDLNGKAAEGLFLRVNGKGGVERDVPVSPALVKELAAELSRNGFPADPLDPANASIPIIARFQNRLGPTPLPWSKSGLYKSIQAFMGRCADKVGGSDAADIRKASTHWLRHTHASHALNGPPGKTEMRVPLETVKNNLGHASLATTSLYLTTQDDARIQAMAAFWAKEASPAA